MAKDAAERIVDASALVAMLSELEAAGLHGAPSREVARVGGAVSGQHLVSVLVAVPRPFDGGSAFEPEPLREALRELGAYYERLPDGSLVVTLHAGRQRAEWSAVATDQAYRIARCALLIKARWPDAAIAIGTGRGQAQRPLSPQQNQITAEHLQRLPVGEAIDRACRLLAESLHDPAQQNIVVDDLTAGLIDHRYKVEARPGGAFTLTGDAIDGDAGRLLLGQAPPCVGREQELEFLEQQLQVAVEESRACAVLVTAPPGGGKSRLRHEFLRRLAAQHREPLILLGSGDPMNTSAPYGVLRSALRRRCAIRELDPPSEQRHKLQRLISAVPESAQRRVLVCLGELCGAPFPVEDYATLQTARSNPATARSELREAFVDFLRAECTRQPVLLILEDLHWSDEPTVRLIDEALRESSQQPLMVLALARPSVNELFPSLWDKRVQRVPLRPLGKRASERLVRQILGPDTPAETVARIIDQAGGNALFLEELIRSVAESRGEALPDTVLAMLQARLGSLDAEARRLLRAASIFGGPFHPSGVAALLTDGTTMAQILRVCATLVRQEILSLHDSLHDDSEAAYRFRPALLRDAAYTLLTDEQRRLFHRRASRYLESQTPLAFVTLAEHCLRGNEPQRAAQLYRRAAEAALADNDVAQALAHIDSGMRCGPIGEVLSALQKLRARCTADHGGP